MQSQLPLNLLQQKINELQTALFFNRSTSIFRIPSSVIHVIAVDEAGQIWFCLPSLQQTASELDEHFFCDLQFFRKEKEFYVRISGIASMVKDPEDINDISFMSQEMKALIRAGRSILIKVKIRGADYFENKDKKKR